MLCMLKIKVSEMYTNFRYEFRANSSHLPLALIDSLFVPQHNRKAPHRLKHLSALKRGRTPTNELQCFPVCEISCRAIDENL